MYKQRRLKMIFCVNFLLIVSVIFGVEWFPAKKVDAAGLSATSVSQKPGYTLVAHDEFDRSYLDETLWFPWYLPHWTERELCKANYELRDGKLILKITPEMRPWDPVKDHETVISSIQTAEKDWLHKWSSYRGLNHSEPSVINYLQKYGYFEIRAKMQSGGGIHCAWWMIGAQQDAYRWDDSKQTCEIDIFEALGRRGAKKLKFNIIPWNDPDMQKTSLLNEIDIGFDISEEFHVYGFEWDETSMKLYVDGKLIKQYDQSVHYPMLTLLGIYEKRHGGWTGPFDPEVPYPKEFIIDYWRAYQRDDMIHRNNEAEHAALNGETRSEKVLYDVSNERIVRYVGNDPENWIEFNCLYANKAGKYNLNIDYISGEDRDLYVQVNQGRPIQIISLNSGSWKNVATETIEVRLKKGNNTIKLYNDKSWAPDIDRIRIDKVSNIAPSASVSATTSKRHNSVTNINDMNRASYYESLPLSEYPQYITFQWTEKNNFSKIRLSSWYGKEQGITDFDIEVSEDGVTNWTKVASFKNICWDGNSSTAETKEFDFKRIRNKKGIRLKVNSTNARLKGLNINEIEIY